LLPGTYSVQATAAGFGYVADLRCGSTDLLRDDLTLAPGGSPPPIEVTLRNDGAELNGSVTHNNRPLAASVVIYSQVYPKRSLLIRANDSGTFSMNDLPPGSYLVFAMRDAEDLEYRNPIAVEKYLGEAKPLTLAPREKATIQLELQPQDAQQ
jgi:hypothetical protein